MFSNNLEMIVERGFPLLKKINEIISSMRDMGLMTKFIEDFQYNTTILAKLKKNSNIYVSEDEVDDKTTSILSDEEFADSDEEETRVVLTVEHLEGGFTLLLMGYVISVAVFVVELFAYSKFYMKCANFCMKLFTRKQKIVKNKTVSVRSMEKMKEKTKKRNKYKIYRRKWKSPKLK